MNITLVHNLKLQGTNFQNGKINAPENSSKKSAIESSKLHLGKKTDFYFISLLMWLVYDMLWGKKNNKKYH